MRVTPTLLALSLGIAACSPVTVKTDVDPQASFTQLRSFAWLLHEPGTGPAVAGSSNPLVDNSLVQQRIRAAIESRLAGKGYRLVNPDQRPDFLVADHVGIQHRVDFSAVRYHTWWGGPAWWWGPRVTRVEETPYTEGTLMVDVVDPTGDRLEWRGYARDVVNGPDVSEKQIDKAITKILDRFPPKQA